MDIDSENYLFLKEIEIFGKYLIKKLDYFGKCVIILATKGIRRIFYEQE